MARQLMIKNISKRLPHPGKASLILSAYRQQPFITRYAPLNGVLSAGQNRFYYKDLRVLVIPNG